MFSVFMAMSMSQSYSHVMRVLDVVPMARRRRDLLFILHSHRNLDINVNKDSTLFDDLFFNLHRYFYIHIYVNSDRDSSLLKHFNLNWHFNLNLFGSLDRYFNLHIVHLDDRFLILLLYFNYERNHICNFSILFLRLHDSKLFHDNLRHFHRDSLNVVLGDYTLFLDNDNLDFGR